MAEHLFAAQPIYTADSDLYAHELLYRNESGITAVELGDDHATKEVLYNLCTGILEHVEHFHKPICINVDADFLLSRSFLPLKPEQVIIELVERIEPTPQLIDAVKDWVSKGYRFALDDFAFDESWHPLVELAHIIKVDISDTSIETVKVHKALWKDLNLKWLAEKVEDNTTFELYNMLGFDLYQGYYFAKPKVIEGMRIPAAATQLSMVMQHLFDDDVDLYELVAALQTDPVLVVNLLRIANSPYYATSRKVESLKEVVMLLGLEPLRKWVLLIVSLQGTKPAKAQWVLTRAYMCSELMLALKPEHKHLSGPAFLTGLLSGADLLLNMPKQEFINRLNVASSVSDAVLQHDGELGKILSTVEKFEYALSMKQSLAHHPKLFSIYNQCHFLVQELMQNVALETA